MRAIIIDDEPKAQKVLEVLLQKCTVPLEIVGKASSVAPAKAMIEQLKPDLLFLDITMPDGTGFDLLRSLQQRDFEVIFTTSHENYMLDAIRFCAIGYVLKPIARTDLYEAVQNAHTRHQKQIPNPVVDHLVENLEKPYETSNTIGIPTSEALAFYKVGNILRCEGQAGYTNIVFENEKPILSSYNLGEFRRLLQPYGFWDIHKSYIINPNHIKRYDHEGITLSDGVVVPVSRRRRAEVSEQLRRLSL